MRLLMYVLGAADFILLFLVVESLEEFFSIIVFLMTFMDLHTLIEE